MASLSATVSAQSEGAYALHSPLRCRLRIAISRVDRDREGYPTWRPREKGSFPCKLPSHPPSAQTCSPDFSRSVNVPRGGNMPPKVDSPATLALAFVRSTVMIIRAGEHRPRGLTTPPRHRTAVIASASTLGEELGTPRHPRPILCPCLPSGLHTYPFIHACVLTWASSW